jgi:hypothetical protein
LKKILVSLLVLVIAVLPLLMPVSLASARETETLIVQEAPKNWTFMVYLDGDNNLEECGIEIFLRMASVGSSSEVNIVVQMDRISGYDNSYGGWTGCKRFYVTAGLTPTSENAVADLPEVNMGNPSTLSDFVNWAAASYPATHYCLVLYDHGSGCVQITSEGFASEGFAPMGVCFDFTSGDVLTLPELSQAFASVTSEVDVIFFDACMMGMIEVAYQIRNYADIMVGSEEVGWTPGPYDDYLTGLTSNPAMSPAEFASAIVNYYIAWLDPTSYPSTMSATNLAQVSSLATATSNFAQVLMDKEDQYHDEINQARSNTEGYEGPYSGYYGYYIDLYHFAQLVYQSVADVEVRAIAYEVATILSNTIIHEGDNGHPNSHGLSIFFPENINKYLQFESAYLGTTFAVNTQWDEFVEHHYTSTKVDTVLDLWFTPNPVDPGATVALSGTLRTTPGGSPVYPASVTVDYSTDGGATWNYAWTLSTNAAGAFSTSFTAPGEGTYLVRVSYAGSASYNPSSHTETLTAGPAVWGDYHFRISPFIDKIHIKISGNVIYGVHEIPGLYSETPLLGWIEGSTFYILVDYPDGVYSKESMLLVGSTSTLSGSFYQTSDGTSWSGPTSFSLVSTSSTSASSATASVLASGVEPESWPPSYHFRLSPWIDIVRLGVDGSVIHGTDEAAGYYYDEPVLGYISGSFFILGIDWTGGGGYEMGIIRASTSTMTGYAYRTTDGKSYVSGPTITFVSVPP